MCKQITTVEGKQLYVECTLRVIMIDQAQKEIHTLVRRGWLGVAGGSHIFRVWGKTTINQEPLFQSTNVHL